MNAILCSFEMSESNTANPFRYIFMKCSFELSVVMRNKIGNVTLLNAFLRKLRVAYTLDTNYKKKNIFIVAWMSMNMNNEF